MSILNYGKCIHCIIQVYYYCLQVSIVEKNIQNLHHPPTHTHTLSLCLLGVRQALWLTKTKLILGLPPQLLSQADNPANQIPDQDERVKNAIKHARFWDTTEKRPGKEKYRYCVSSE